MKHAFGEIRRFCSLIPLKRFCSDRVGSAATIFALSILPMMLAVGGAVDYARYYDTGQELQTALDAAVLAGASAGNNSSVAAKTFTSWTVKIDGTVNTPGFCVGKLSSTSTSSCSGDGTTKYYSGVASGQLNLYFTRLAGFSTVTVNATATAEKTSDGGSTSTSSSCIILLSTSASPGLNVNNQTINASTCEVDVFSKASHPVTLDRTITTAKLCIAGTPASGQSPNVIPSNYYTGCTPPADPFASSVKTLSDAIASSAASSCSSSGNSVNYNSSGATTIGDSGGTFTANNLHCGQLNINGTPVTLYPGVYGGGINFNASSPSITLQPGLYVIKNTSWYINGGTFTGTGVTFYFPQSGIFMQFNNTATANLSAPTSGTYSGVLMFEPAALSSSAWTTNMTGTWSGLVYLPSRNMTFNSGGPITQSGTFVFNTLTSSEIVNISGSSSVSGSGGTQVIRLIH